MNLVKATKSWRIRKAYFLAIAAIFSLLAATAWADTIVRGFDAVTTISPGWVVSLTKKQPNAVELTPAKDSSRIYGVVIDPSQAPVTLQPQQGRRIFVATNGTYPVLVSAVNGKVNPGDYLSMSKTDGIAAKATPDQTTILGQALEKFDGVNSVITKGEHGESIGRVSASIAPGRNPLSSNFAAIPAPLRRAGEAIAGKNVTPPRIYGALAVFLVTAAIAISVLISGVRNGMISIGRNPLSKTPILRGLFQVTIVAVVVFGIGVFAVYLLLKL
jgi:hypothetical protein